MLEFQPQIPPHDPTPGTLPLDTASLSFEADFRQKFESINSSRGKHHTDLEIDNSFDGIFGFPSVVRSSVMRGAFMHGYVAAPLARIMTALKEYPLSPRDVFCDIGAGLCRVPIFVRCWAGCAAYGVDYDPALIRRAEEAIRRVNLGGVTTIVEDARKLNYEFANVFFFYQPFDGPVLDAVLEKLRVLSETKPITIWWLGNHRGWPEKASWLSWEVNHLRQPWDYVSVAKSR